MRGAGAPCINRAKFIADLTIPDDTVLTPGATFTKSWRLRNDGSCSWGANNGIKSIVFVGGDRLNAQGEGAMPGETPPGYITDVAVQMTAPVTPGTYTSRWKLLVDNGDGLLHEVRAGVLRANGEYVIMMTPGPSLQTNYRLQVTIQ